MDDESDIQSLKRMPYPESSEGSSDEQTEYFTLERTVITSAMLMDTRKRKNEDSTRKSEQRIRCVKDLQEFVLSTDDINELTTVKTDLENMIPTIGERVKKMRNFEMNSTIFKLVSPYLSYDEKKVCRLVSIAWKNVSVQFVQMDGAIRFHHLCGRGSDETLISVEKFNEAVCGDGMGHDEDTSICDKTFLEGFRNFNFYFNDAFWPKYRRKEIVATIEKFFLKASPLGIQMHLHEWKPSYGTVNWMMLMYEHVSSIPILQALKVKGRIGAAENGCVQDLINVMGRKVMKNLNQLSFHFDTLLDINLGDLRMCLFRLQHLELFNTRSSSIVPFLYRHVESLKTLILQEATRELRMPLMPRLKAFNHDWFGGVEIQFWQQDPASFPSLKKFGTALSSEGPNFAWLSGQHDGGLVPNLESLDLVIREEGVRHFALVLANHPSLKSLNVTLHTQTAGLKFWPTSEFTGLRCLKIETDNDAVADCDASITGYTRVACESILARIRNTSYPSMEALYMSLLEDEFAVSRQTSIRYFRRIQRLEVRGSCSEVTLLFALTYMA